MLDANDTTQGHISQPKSAFYRTMLDRLVVPNIRSGVMHLAKQALQNDDYIPIHSSSSSETIHYKKDTYLPSTRQRERITELTSRENNGRYSALSQTILANWGKHGYHLAPLATHRNDTAAVHTMVHKEFLDGGSLLRIFGQPVILLNNDYDRAQSSHRPDAIAHEFEHVEQNIQRALGHYATFTELSNDALAEEVAAYRAQAVVLNEVYRQGGQDEDFCARDKTAVNRVKEATDDVPYDVAGNVFIDQEYRHVLMQRLTVHNLEERFPDFDQSAADKTLVLERAGV